MEPPTQRDDGTATGARPPKHNWRPTVVHGTIGWLLLGVGALLPLGRPLALGIGIVGLFVAPVVPVALYCDYRQARAFGPCSPGIRGYLRNVCRDVRTTVTRGDRLGSERVTTC